MGTEVACEPTLRGWMGFGAGKGYQGKMRAEKWTLGLFGEHSEATV